MYPSFNWWIGIVEDRVDPAQLGRCKVRIIGYHTENRIELPTENLPWAVPVMPATSPSLSGVGETPSFVQGTTVVGFLVTEKMNRYLSSWAPCQASLEIKEIKIRDFLIQQENIQKKVLEQDTMAYKNQICLDLHETQWQKVMLVL